ncbi:MAG: hypothetical protein OK436_02600 [Thaumarchaeota archaeon]|nr:hypothetical protein [Nitrososphaerota archaeon]
MEVVDVLVVDVLIVDVLDDVIDELPLVVETFPGEVASKAKAEIATITTTATARTAPRFTVGAKSESPIKGSQVYFNI